jgi:plastocyanin
MGMVTRDERILEGNVTIQPGDYFTFTWTYNTYHALSVSSNGTVFARKIDNHSFVTSFSPTQMQDAKHFDYEPPGDML